MAVYIKDTFLEDAMNCTHDHAEMDTAVADGMCPLCLAIENDDLRRQLVRLAHLITGSLKDNSPDRDELLAVAKGIIAGNE